VLARALGVLLFAAVMLYRATLRIRVVGSENQAAATALGRPVLHAIWHQRMIGGILAFGYHRVVTLASRSRDGQIIATFLSLWGFRVVRGSSSRGGAPALKALVDGLAGTKRWAALTTDGPRGPARKSKPGIAFLSDELDASILPTGTSASRPRFLGSWDRTLVPLPFSRCVVVFGEPLSRKPGEADAELLARVDAAIDAATEEADRLCAVVDAPRERAARIGPAVAEQS